MSAELESDIEKFRCGNCIGCFRTTNCEKCDNCIKSVVPCLRRICVQSGLIKSPTSPTKSSDRKTSKAKSKRGTKKGHGTKTKGQKTKKTPTRLVQRKNPTREKRASSSKVFSETSDESFYEEKPEKLNISKDKNTTRKSPSKSPAKEALHVKDENEVCCCPLDFTCFKVKREDVKTEGPNTVYAQTQPSSDAQTIGSPVKQRKPHKPHKPHVWKTKEQRMALKLLKEKQEEMEQRQCLGPGCAKYARFDSKYCSEQCGLALAHVRLCRILPFRVQDFYSEKPMSELDADMKIQKLTSKKAEIEQGLGLADSYTKNLDLYLSVLAQGTAGVPTGSNGNDKTEEELSFPVCCVVCGVEYPVKSLPKHIQKCFVKLEKQTSFGTKTKFSYNPNNILCETFDKTTGTYCKRLRIMCSEHYKDDIGSQMKVCGYPIVWGPGRSLTMREMFGDLESILAEGMCFAGRKTCEKHYLWEQTAYALIENERMSLLLQLDEITDSYRRLAEVYRTRGDAVTLLLNWRQIGHGTRPINATQAQQELQLMKLIAELTKENGDVKGQVRPIDPTRPRRGRPPGQTNRNKLLLQQQQQQQHQQQCKQSALLAQRSPPRPHPYSQPSGAVVATPQMVASVSARTTPQPSRFVVRQQQQQQLNNSHAMNRPQVRYNQLPRQPNHLQPAALPPARQLPAIIARTGPQLQPMNRVYEVRRERSRTPPQAANDANPATSLESGFHCEEKMELVDQQADEQGGPSDESPQKRPETIRHSHEPCPSEMGRTHEPRVAQDVHMEHAQPDQDRVYRARYEGSEPYEAHQRQVVYHQVHVEHDARLPNSQSGAQHEQVEYHEDYPSMDDEDEQVEYMTEEEVLKQIERGQELHLAEERDVVHEQQPEDQTKTPTKLVNPNDIDLSDDPRPSNNNPLLANEQLPPDWTPPQKS